MKRLKFATVEALILHLREEQVNLVVEYRDEAGKQRQVTLTQDRVEEVGELLTQSQAMAYYRKDGIFYEIVAEWLK
ncbi:hypothetical protein ACQCN2_16750 [Brevibacillus ginsengisoli]|uniref:hypothetical protein n=1 Tax=Brevibacillus ginsengisoli TaxID=363854 RepID=UPI003CEDAE3C